MRKLNTVFLLLVLFIGAWPLVATSADYPAPGNSGKGSVLWAHNCNRCHNLRGPEDLRDDQWITTIFHMRVRAGLTGQETRDIITYMQASNNKPAAIASTTKTASTTASGDQTSSAKSGEDIYNQTCVACHGGNGKGLLPGVPDFTSKDSRLNKPDEQLINSITNGFKSPGSPMAMPPKGGNSDLNANDVKSVLKYLHEKFSHK